VQSCLRTFHSAQHDPAAAAAAAPVLHAARLHLAGVVHLQWSAIRLQVHNQHVAGSKSLNIYTDCAVHLL
jgi:hypothetical protein